MVTIKNIRDLEKFLFEHFWDEPTVNVHVVTGECPGDTVAVEVIPATPEDGAWVAFFGLTFDDDGHPDGIQGTAYDRWDPESGPLWWQSEYGTYLGWIPSAQDGGGFFYYDDLSAYIGRAFGTLWHSKRFNQQPTA